MSPYIKDLSLRVVVMFLFTFLSVLSFTDLSTSKDAAIAGAAAAAEVIRGWLGKFVGDPDNAGFHK